MTLFLDGGFTITCAAGRLVISNEMNHAYISGKSDEPLGDKTYMIPQGGKFLALEVGWMSGSTTISVEAEGYEVKRLIETAKETK